MAGCAARAPPGCEARLSLATFLLGASVLALPLLTRAGLQGRTGLALYVQMPLLYKSLYEIFTIKRILRSFSACFLMETTISGTIDSASIQSPTFCQC
uniref:Uncharacterized protein n=1 Tax=Panthera leo TaxID=9689 RepID=A0A8C8XVU4_PANLE